MYRAVPAYRSTAPLLTPKGQARQPLPAGWEAVIGIECHAQLRVPRKLFSGTPPPTAHSAPNTCVGAFDAAFPGTLPVVQDAAVNAAVKAALALGCTLAPVSGFDRKHYFYADQPAGYQITQHLTPFAHSGTVAIRYEDGYLSNVDDALDVPILQLQLEQDTAKSTYFALDDVGGAGGRKSDPVHATFVDFDRAGVALVEIVSGPVMRTPEQAGAYVRKVRSLLRCVGASDGNMNEGSLRCDANVSVHRIGTPFGARCEVKNLNSVKFMMHALAFEVQRQLAVLQGGGTFETESRGFDEARGVTYSMRSKETTPDYRYMPEPNLPPLHVSQERITAVAATLPELPDARHRRLREEYGLAARDVNLLTRVNAEDDAMGAPESEQRAAEACGSPAADSAQSGGDMVLRPNAVDYFEDLVRLGVSAPAAVNWTIQHLPKHLNAAGIAFCHSPIPPRAVAELVSLVDEDVITASTAQTLLADMVKARAVPHEHGVVRIREHVHARDLGKLRTPEALRAICEPVVAELTSEVQAVRAGKHKVLAKLVGEVMRRAHGRVDAAEASGVLQELVLGTGASGEGTGQMHGAGAQG
ncbi:hypothetical protein MSPP1_003720 [Malassezia sp. CBS 17886]|nr:hypothetical protein MSPP1_003720 [Malassezia sp. CBS 17886]